MRISKARSAISAALLALVAGVPGAAEVDEPAVKKLVTGRYEIRMGEKVLGEERFEETTFEDNTIVLECTYRVRWEGERELIVEGETYLEADDDSRFPRKYRTKKVTNSAGEASAEEAEAELFANVVVFERQVGESRLRTTQVLPTGCLFIEQNIAHQLSAVLHRYRPSNGKKQVFEAFEPSIGRMISVAIEFMGPVPEEQNEGGPPLLHYRFHVAGSPANDMYVDADSGIVRGVVTAQKVEYHLTSLDVSDGSE